MWIHLVKSNLSVANILNFDKFIHLSIEPLVFLRLKPLIVRWKASQLNYDFTTTPPKTETIVAKNNCWDDRPFPPPPEFNVETWSYLSSEAPQLCAGGGGGIISSSYMLSSVWEWSTEFVVRVLFVTVDGEEAF